MTRRRTRIEARMAAYITDAAALAAYITPGLQGIDEGKGGFKTTTPGANPDSPSTPTGPDQLTGTITERNALTPDRAQLDEDALNKAIRAAHTHTILALIIAKRWAIPFHQGETITSRIAAIDEDLWCDNCHRWGFHNVRRPNGKHCEFCAGFNSKWKQLPPRDVLELQAAKGRLYVNDIRRILGRQKKGAA